MSDWTGSALLERSGAAQHLIAIASTAGISLDGVWLVGGAVRDAALGRVDGAWRDVDIAVEGSGIDLARALAQASGGEVVAVHEFGTATVIVPREEAVGAMRIDVASCRDEVYLGPGTLPTVRVGAAIDVDMGRRDVSVNAVAVRLVPNASGQHAIVDPFDGLADIAVRRLRVLHDRSFVDDPTRILRVARYAGRLDLRVGDATRALAIDAIAGGALATISADRLRTELELVLREPAWEALTLLASWGMLSQLDPRLEAAFHPPLLLPAIDAGCGTDELLNDRAWKLRLAALARPLGEDAGGWLRWLGFASHDSDSVLECAVVVDAVLDRGAQLVGMRNSELYRELGEVSDDAFALAALTAAEDVALLDRLGAFRVALRDTQLTVRGDDVVAAGVPQGPIVGRILGELFLRSLDGEIAGERDERALLARIIESGVE